MRNVVDLRTSLALGLGALLLLGATQARAYPGILNDWQSRYGAVSASGDNAQCQLCHANANGGAPWNAYGWDVLEAREDLACDLNGDGQVSNDEAFYCVETLNSDGDAGGNDNLTETAVSTQPGWTQGPHNTLYTRSGTIENQLPPDNIGQLDPDGTEPLPPDLPPPPDDTSSSGPKLFVQFVRPGQSIQKALDRARYGGFVFVFPGVYHELADPTNGLQITRGVKLIGLSSHSKRVVLENAGNQRNGIVAVPDDRTDCMGCHTDMAPPFPLHPDVKPGLTMDGPMIHGLKISGITIRNFRNNGLFTEHVDGYNITDVESIGNKNYGIFPTLSKNGRVAWNHVTGADDSGIWVETSENIEVVHNLVEGNVNGFEVSNSDYIHLAHNVTRDNSVGMAILLLPDIFDSRPGSKHLTIEKNQILHNNKLNTASEGSILSMVPAGTGILFVGVDDSLIRRNLIRDNDSVGLAMVDYCLVVFGTPFDCEKDPSVSDDYIADQGSTGNRIADNVLVHNGTNPDPTNPFAFAASDLAYIVATPDAGNCRVGNVFTTLFQLFRPLPECP